MSYIIPADYVKHIQALNLNQVIGNNQSLLQQWQRTAQEKVVSYLTQKYDTAAEFTDTSIWRADKTYYPGSRIYLDAASYVPTSNYLLGDTALYQGSVYVALEATTGAFDLNKWTLLGAQQQIFYGTLPYPPFNINNYYQTGDKVFWKGKTYTAASGSMDYDPIQYRYTSGTPARNYFPDQTTNGQSNSQWGAGSTDIIPAGTLLSSALWTEGDNRSAEMVQVCVDIVLFYVHQRISPMNIPTLRHDNYKMAIQWLMDCATGMVTPNLPVKQPDQGHRMRIFGAPKLNNSY